MSTKSRLPVRRKSWLDGVSSWVGQRVSLTDTKFWTQFFGASAWAGEPVTPEAAMQISAVWRAVRLTASTIACMPLSMYEDTSRGPQLRRGDETDLLVRVSPNEDQTPVEFWEQVVGCCELIGDGLARKHTIGRRTVALTVMNPRRCEIRRNVSGGLEYRYTDDKGRLEILSPADVFHLKGFSLGGDRGISTVAAGVQTMSLARAAEKAQGRLFASGLRGAGFLETDQVLNEGDRPRLQKIVNEYVGADNAGGLMILEGGMSYKALGMSSQDAEMLLTRRFSIEEIGRWFDLPPILLGHAVDGQTMWGSGVIAILQSWLSLGLNQRLVRIEKAISKRLLPASERSILYPKYNADALLRTNSPERAQFISTLVQNGILNRDEARELLERGKIPGGEIYTAQVNLAPLQELGQSSGQAAGVREAIRGWLGVTDADPSREQRTLQ